MMFLDASVGGSMRVKTDHEVQTLKENMAQNDNRANAEKKKRGVFGVSDNTTILANQVVMNKPLEALTKNVYGLTLAQQKQQMAAVKCDFCGEGHANGECVPEGVSEHANYLVNYQTGNPYSNTYNLGWANHPNLKYTNNNTLNHLLPNPQQQ